MSLDDASFSEFFDNDSRLVKEHEFRKAVFRGNFGNYVSTRLKM
jgi:hypothetical protein